jgi:hypothetical protein
MYHSKVLMVSAQTLSIIQILLIYFLNIQKILNIFEYSEDFRVQVISKLLHVFGIILPHSSDIQDD